MGGAGGLYVQINEANSEVELGFKSFRLTRFGFPSALLFLLFLLLFHTSVSYTAYPTQGCRRGILSQVLTVVPTLSVEDSEILGPF